MSELIIPEIQLYQLAVIVLAIATMGFVVWTITLPAGVSSLGRWSIASPS